jgi:hypothetical protein
MKALVELWTINTPAGRVGFVIAGAMMFFWLFLAVALLSGW